MVIHSDIHDCLGTLYFGILVYGFNNIISLVCDCMVGKGFKQLFKILEKLTYFSEYHYFFAAVIIVEETLTSTKLCSVAISDPNHNILQNCTSREKLRFL